MPSKKIRDKIYEELLIVQMTPGDREKYDEARTHEHVSDYERERAFDLLDQDYALTPGIGIGTQKTKGTRYIARNKGILLANKQIYGEATIVLFSKNLWGATPEFERVWSFWRCNFYTCQPVERPCYVRPENIAKIKHLLIIVNARGDSGPTASAEVENLKKNLFLMVDTLKSADTKLQTLKVRYWTQYGGEVEAMRDELEAPLPKGIPDSPIMMKNLITGRYIQIRRNELRTKLFRNISILESLRSLRGTVQEVSIRGDLPQKYKNDLTKLLTSRELSAFTKKKQQKEAGVAQKRKAAASKPTGDLATFARDMLAKNPNADAGTKKLYQDLMRTSIKSPAVMAELFRPPTQAEIDRISAQVRAERAPRARSID